MNSKAFYCSWIHNMTDSVFWIHALNSQVAKLKDYYLCCEARRTNMVIIIIMCLFLQKFGENCKHGGSDNFVLSLTKTSCLNLVWIKKNSYAYYYFVVTIFNILMSEINNLIYLFVFKNVCQLATTAIRCSSYKV